MVRETVLSSVLAVIRCHDQHQLAFALVARVPKNAQQVRNVRQILEGKVDDLPEGAFFYAGTIDEVRANAERMTRA